MTSLIKQRVKTRVCIRINIISSKAFSADQMRTMVSFKFDLNKRFLPKNNLLRCVLVWVLFFTCIGTVGVAVDWWMVITWFEGLHFILFHGVISHDREADCVWRRRFFERVKSLKNETQMKIIPKTKKSINHMFIKWDILHWNKESDKPQIAQKNLKNKY